MNQNNQNGNQVMYYSECALLILVDVKGLRGSPTSPHVHSSCSVLIVPVIVIAASSTGQRSTTGKPNAAFSSHLPLNDGLPPVLEEGHRVAPHRH